MGLGEISDNRDFMKPLFLFILLLVGQIELVAQSALPAFTSAQRDTLTFLQYFPTKANFLFIYSEESYWWSNTENFKIIAKAENKWTAWTYYRKWKSSSNVHSNKGKKETKYFKRICNLDSVSIRDLFDSLASVNFCALNNDSLNETRGTSIFDDVNYKFQIENVQNRQVLQSYAPEYYLEMFPDMQQRVLFLKGRDVFKRWWKRHCR